jgi:hypothetical protein
MLFIKNIPKEVLLYELWLHAKSSPYIRYCPELKPVLTVELAKEALNNMISNNDLLSVCTFYGRPVYVDITNDTLDPSNYDMHNGKKLAELVVTKLKKKLLDACLLKHIIKS